MCVVAGTSFMIATHCAWIESLSFEASAIVHSPLYLRMFQCML